MASHMTVVSERVVAEVKCHLCGRVAGSLERQRSPLATPVVFRPRSTDGQPVRVANWAKLRCQSCGGTLYLDQVQMVRERIEPTPEQLWGGEPRRRRARDAVN
jgi:hypothetical protein